MSDADGPGTRSSFSTADSVLTAIPAVLAAAVLVGVATAASTTNALAVGGTLALLATGYALFGGAAEN